jgi:hypothetical protein
MNHGDFLGQLRDSMVGSLTGMLGSKVFYFNSMLQQDTKRKFSVGSLKFLFL